MSLSPPRRQLLRRDGSDYSYAADLVALAPDVILATGGTVVGALQQATRAVPIVFVLVSDPVTRGLVASLPRPGGNPPDFCWPNLP